MNVSIPMMEYPCEFINIVPFNPLISKCQIKVCYVGQQPNRNGSIITKEVATEMANSLPGSPIVGYFNKDTQDFEEHNRDFEIKDGELKLTDATRPYGFVDLNAKCWFKKFRDNGVIHEYLCTEGWLWTGQYPECQRAIDKGNNQSMELDEKTLKANWANFNNENHKFFIINEAIISKLCILGEDFEPCFEGASISNIQFSLEDSFKQKLFSMMEELKNLLNEGGPKMFNVYTVTVGDNLWTALYSFVEERGYASIEAVLEDGERKFAVIKDKAENIYSLDFSVAEDGGIQLAEEVVGMENYTPAEEPQFSLTEVEDFIANFKKKDEKNEDKKDEEDASKTEDNSEEDNSKKSSEEEDDEEKKKEEEKKKKYSLEEIPEYVELAKNYNALQNSFNELNSKYEALNAENATLVEFKLAAERKDKEAMIKGFYMLSDEDKADVVANIDKYSLDDIEAKLSIICVRNKVSFNLDEEKDDKKEPTIYNLNSHEEKETTPAWVKAALETAKKL